MRLREPAGRRGGRDNLMRAAEAVGRTEPEEPPQLRWVEVSEQAEVMEGLFAVLEQTKAAAKENGDEVQELHQDRLKLAFLLSALCRNIPELQSLKAKDLKLIADQRMDDDDFGGHLDDWLVPKFSSSARGELVESEIGENLSTLLMAELRLKLLLSVAIGAPSILKKYRRGLTNDLPKFTSSIRSGASFLAIVEVARLILVYPEKRGEFLSLLSPASISDFKRKVIEMENILRQAGIRLSDAKFLAELLFSRQVVAAEATQILPNGDIEFTPPKKKFGQPLAPLPDRDIG